MVRNVQIRILKEKPDSLEIKLPFNPMKEWNIDGMLCGNCYSKQLHEYYPGDHIRVNKELD